MGNFEAIVSGFKQALSTTDTVALTATGKSKAENASVAGARYDILAHLSERGPSSVKEIAEETHLRERQVKHLVKIMIREGFIRKTGGD